MKHTPNELHEIKFKKLVYKLVGIHNYLMQDHECERDKTNTQKLWKALEETIELLMKLIEHLYLRKINDIQFTENELNIMKDTK